MSVITTDNEVQQRPTAIFSQIDIPLIKDALIFYKTQKNLDEDKLKQIERLYHRLGRI